MMAGKRLFRNEKPMFTALQFFPPAKGIRSRKVSGNPKEKETRFTEKPDLLHESYFEGKSLRVSDSDLYQAFLTEATRAAKPSLSLTAMSARTLRSRPMPAFLRPFMNTE